MHIKFVRTGRSGQKAAAYLLRKREAEEVIVRRGDPEFFADLVDSLDYRNRYSSAVIAFAPEDQPTEEQIEEVIEKFKLTAWAGLEDADFCTLVVEHRRKDGKGTHLHFLMANFHLSRKKHFNPAPPGWQKRYDLLRDYLNLKYGWARPDDEKRARKVQPGYLAFPGVAAEKRQVLAWAEAMAEMGLGAEEIAEVARASGAEVPRRGKDYLTLAWGKKRVRVPIGKKKKKKVEAATIEEQERKWQSALEKLAAENRERYGPKGERIEGITQGGILKNGIRILCAPEQVDRTTVERISDGTGTGRGAEAPAGGIRGSDGADQGRAGGAAPGAGGAAPAAGSPEPGMAGLWAALERLLRRLGSRLGGALGRANATVARLYTAAYRLVAAGGMRPTRGAEQAGQPPAARREVPRANVPGRGWPPGRQGPGWG